MNFSVRSVTNSSANNGTWITMYGRGMVKRNRLYVKTMLRGKTMEVAENANYPSVVKDSLQNGLSRGIKKRKT